MSQPRLHHCIIVKPRPEQVAGTGPDNEQGVSCIRWSMEHTDEIGQVSRVESETGSVVGVPISYAFLLG